jgi:nitrate reductase beta subunit
MSVAAVVKVLDDDERIRSPKEMLVMLIMAEMAGGGETVEICSAPADKIAMRCRMKTTDVERVQARLIKKGVLTRTQPDDPYVGFVIARWEAAQ